jgi:uncharacterized membrane protein
MSNPTGAETSQGRLSRLLHWLFETSLIIKGTLAAAETLAGLGLALVPNARLVALVDWLVRNEIAQDPKDPLANALLRAVSGPSLSHEHFYALYIGAHGALKLAMVLLLARGVRWAFPAAMVLLAGFALFEIVGVLRGGPPPLALLAGLDTVMIALVWREWLRLDDAAGPPRPAG